MDNWIISCNPDYYDVINAFNEFNTLNWKQSTNIKVGDVVYIYVSSPYKAIKYKTEVSAVNLSEYKTYDSDFVIDGSHYEDHGRYMELEFLQTFDDDLLPYDVLKANGLGSVQGPSRMTYELESFVYNKLKSLKRRNYFFVFQNKSYPDESKGGYLWAPLRASNGNKVSHYEQMKDIRKGDLIIHSYHKKIVAISIAETDVYKLDKPREKNNQDEWGNEGRAVSTKYYNINKPIVTSDHKETLLKLQPEKYAPFNVVNGRGNTGYLYTSNKEMAEYIIEESVKNQSSEKDKKELLKHLNNTYIKLDEDNLDQDLINDVNLMLDDKKESLEKYQPEPKEKAQVVVKNRIRSYPRDRKIAIRALKRANFKCEINENHPSFIRKNSNTNYTEPHHLVPMAYQDEFKNSLDVQANIVSLCSNCHNQAHYGENAKEIIKELFNLRKKELNKAGITITYDELFKMY